MRDRLLIAILAAGASRRLGQPKQLVRIADEPLLRRQARIAIESQIAPVTVVLGCDAHNCEQCIADLPVAIRICLNWQQGLALSIRSAVQAAIEQDADGLLLLHGDQYCVSADDLRNLQAAWFSREGVIACRSVHQDYAGPPVVLPKECFPVALALDGDEGARRILADRAAEAIIDVLLPNAVADLDTPTQLQELQEMRA